MGSLEWTGSFYIQTLLITSPTPPGTNVSIPTLVYIYTIVFLLSYNSYDLRLQQMYTENC